MTANKTALLHLWLSILRIFRCNLVTGKLICLFFVAVLNGCASGGGPSGGGPSGGSPSGGSPNSDDAHGVIAFTSTELSTFASRSEVSTLSFDGTVAGGYANNDDLGLIHAAIWSSLGKDTPGSSVTDLDAFNNSGSNVYTLSADGKVASGAAQDVEAGFHAAIWRLKDDEWSRSRLFTKHNTIRSAAFALSDTGNVAGGELIDKRYTQIGCAVSRGCAPADKPHVVFWSYAVIWRYDETTNQWSEPKTLPTFDKEQPPSNRIRSRVEALSSNGNIAGGWIYNDQGLEHAAIWRYDTTNQNWLHAVDLEPFCNLCTSQVHALSDKETIAGGWAQTKDQNQHAMVWTYINQTWSPTDLGGTFGKSAVTALSSDGTIAGGWAQTKDQNQHAMVWTYINQTWSPTDLGGTFGNSAVNALSGDGTIAGGWSGIDNLRHATLWRLKIPKKEKLNNFTPDNTYRSTVTALSADGTIAGGIFDSHENNHAAIWMADKGNYYSTSWTYPKDLGSLNQNSCASQVNALSGDGFIAGGICKDVATIWWTSDKWTSFSTQTLETDYSGKSAVTALSDNGTIAGWADTPSKNTHATIWRYKDRKWSAKDLGTLNGMSGNSAVTALSYDGTIAGGWADTQSHNKHATVWKYKGKKWSAKDLGTLNGMSGNSAVTALSDKGTIAGGWADTQSQNKHAALWTYKDGAWSATDLGTLNGTSGNSEVNALSHDGTIAGGWGETQSQNTHATIWRYKDKKWSATGIEFTSAKSAITALSADATIAGGYVTENRMNRATLWRLGYLNSSKSSENGTKYRSESKASTETATVANTNHLPGVQTSGNGSDLTVVAKIDVPYTIASVAKLASDRLATIEQQRLGLGRLENGCTPAHVGKSCYSLGGGASGSDRATDVYSEASFGHAFSDNLASGVTIVNTFSNPGNLPGDLKRDGISPGVGVWTRWNEATQDGHWYLRGAVAANRAKIKRSRSGFRGIEPGTGTSTSTGWNIATEFGRGHDLNGSTHLDYYGGLRHSTVRLSGYSETRAPGFPFSWSDATSSRTSTYAGARYRISFGTALQCSIRVELERDLNHEDPTLTAQADGGMHYADKSDLAHTRGSLSTDFSYGFSEAFVLTLNPFLEHSASHENVYGAMLRISGDF